MYLRPWSRCLVAVLLLGALRPPGAGVGPPPAVPAPVRLTPGQEARLQRLAVEQNKAAWAGEMGRALRLGQEVESLRRQWQGPRHWQAIDARYGVERWSRLARLPAPAQKEAGRALRYHSLAASLHARGQFVAAEQSYRESLAFCRKALGEEHPDTAAGYNNVASCLQGQGKHAQAQALYQKSLSIRKKMLGEDHPDTAESYYNLADCLREQGKAAQALLWYEKALTIWETVLGKEHPHTADCYHHFASCLLEQGKPAQALPLFEKELIIRKKALGEEHPLMARCFDSVAFCLHAQGKPAQAQQLAEKALAIWSKALGEEHPATATSSSLIALCLDAQGKAAQALPLYRKALAIRRKALGEENAVTAASYYNLATCLQTQGQTAQALPLFEKALAANKKVLGEGHKDTAISYNNLAFCLHEQGKPAQALPLFERALAISRKALGEEHAHTATCCANLAVCLESRGQFARAEAFHEKALAIRKKAAGEGHPDTAKSYNNLAGCLRQQGKVAQALPLYQKAHAIFEKMLGEDHLHTALSRANCAGCLLLQGKPAQALALFEKALAVWKKELGEDHPDTAHGYFLTALCLNAQGKHKEAIAQWQRALLGFDSGRLTRAEHGFDRARFGAGEFTPRQGLALAYARLKEPEKAWQYAEADLARNLLDDLAGAAPEDRAATEHLRMLDQHLLGLFGQPRRTKDQEALREALTKQRQAVLTQLARRAATRSAGRVAALGEVQPQLPADAALVCWVRGEGELWGCVLRAQGAPRWVQLTGSGAKGAWSAEDSRQPRRLLAALADPRSTPANRRQGADLVRKQWLAPLEKHLRPEGKLPAATRLFVVSPSLFAGLPMELLAPGYTVSYTPSASVLVRTLKAHRPLKTAPALALGDPVFQPPALAAPPKHGLLVDAVLPNGTAHKAGLRPGDVLLRYDDARLASVADLVAALKKNSKGKAAYWRDGKEATVALSLPLGLSVDRRPVAEALQAYRDGMRGATPGEKWAPLPGTRAEALALQRLLGKDCLTLLGSQASERGLEALRPRLHSYRILHLATHGEVNLSHPERSRIILARDRLPTLSENADRAARGQRPYSGELRVEDILGWKLDADLVVLSACQSGLGAQSSGEGLLGFPYALMKAGARSVVLSRWKVDDTATALLMVRFYENLLGKAQGLKKPMGRAEALAEAKQWLRELPKKDAEKLAIALKANKLSGTRGSIVELNVKEKPKLPSGDRPYEHPFFWAAFVLIGDPN